MPPSKRSVARRPVLDEDDIDSPSTNGDDDEAPARPKAMKSAATSAIKGGWGPGQKTMDSTSSFAQTFKPDERSVVIKFLEDEPYASVRRHWIERTVFDDKGQSTKQNRPYTCLLSLGKPECPLCEIGDRPQATACFNVAICDEKGGVDRKSWDVGARLFNVLKAYAGDPKIAPLSRNFFLVSRTGKRGTTQYNVLPVKASALEEDYDVPVPLRSELDALDKYTAEIIEQTPVKTLRELANELVDDYE